MCASRVLRRVCDFFEFCGVAVTAKLQERGHDGTMLAMAEAFAAIGLLACIEFLGFRVSLILQVLIAMMCQNRLLQTQPRVKMTTVGLNHSTPLPARLTCKKELKA